MHHRNLRNIVENIIYGGGSIPLSFMWNYIIATGALDIRPSWDCIWCVRTSDQVIKSQHVRCELSNVIKFQFKNRLPMSTEESERKQISALLSSVFFVAAVVVAVWNGIHFPFLASQSLENHFRGTFPFNFFFSIHINMQ